MRHKSKRPANQPGHSHEQFDTVIEAIKTLPRSALIRVIRLPDGSLTHSISTFSDLEQTRQLRKQLYKAVRQAELKMRDHLKDSSDRRARLVSQLNEAIGNITGAENAEFLADAQEATDELADQSFGLFSGTENEFETTQALFEARQKTWDLEEHEDEIELALTVNAPLSLDELSKYLKRSRATLYRNIASDGLPAHRVRGRRGFLFYRDEVDAWVRKQESGEIKTKKDDQKQHKGHQNKEKDK